MLSMIADENEVSSPEPASNKLPRSSSIDKDGKLRVGSKPASRAASIEKMSPSTSIEEKSRSISPLVKSDRSEDGENHGIKQDIIQEEDPETVREEGAAPRDNLDVKILIGDGEKDEGAKNEENELRTIYLPNIGFISVDEVTEVWVQNNV